MAKRKRSRPLGSTDDYRNLLRITVRLRKDGYLKRFKTDLIEHDKRVLKQSSGPFLWAIREGGTHLLTPEGACYGYHHDKAWKGMKSTFGEKVKIYYASASGKQPRAISASTAGKIAGKWERSCKVRRSLWE
jgi:hypothetical protein